MVRITRICKDIMLFRPHHRREEVSYQLEVRLAKALS